MDSSWLTSGLALITANFPTVMGFFSFLVTSAGFVLTHYWKINRFEAQSDQYMQMINALKAAGVKYRKNDENYLHEKEMIRFLAYGDLIIPFIIKKLIIKILLAILVIITCSMATTIDDSIQKIGAISSLDWIMMIIQFFASLWVSSSDVFLNPDEKIFLKRIQILQFVFYKTFIQPAIGIFNEETANSEWLKHEMDASEKENSEESRIRKAVSEEMTKWFSNNRLPPIPPDS